MKKITISANDLSWLYANSQTREYALHIMEFCKRSQYGYSGKKTNAPYYYCEVEEKFIKELLELVKEGRVHGELNANFMIQLFRKLKKKEDEENETETETEVEDLGW